MLLGFQPRFHAMIRDGSKTHSIRAKRAGRRDWRVGDRVDCYGDARRKTMFLIARFECTRVEDFEITAAGRVLIDGAELSHDEKDQLAWRDGFRYDHLEIKRELARVCCFELMLRFWDIHNGLQKKKRWRGQIIHWKYEAKGLAATA